MKNVVPISVNMIYKIILLFTLLICVPFSDKAPSEAVFRGNEFLSYNPSQIEGEPILSAQDSVTFYFKTRGPNGTLFYAGKPSKVLYSK